MEVVAVRWYRALALDLDGTLTTGGWPTSGVLAEMSRLRADGVALILVTGRIGSVLDVEFPGLTDRFDVVVAENGCVLRTRDWSRPLAELVDPALLHRLHDGGYRVARGEVLLATTAAAGHAALDAIEDLGLDIHLVRNRGELMLLPAGISKGTGLRAALAELGISPHNTIAVGDAENDHPLLAAAELGVAVGNAVQSLRHRADLVLPGDDGRAVAALLSGAVLNGPSRACSPRRRVLIGTDPTGDPVTLPAARHNILISGGSDTGKSYLAGLLTEQLIAQDYTVLVIDPEGDHVPLGTLHGVTVLPCTDLPAADVPALLGHDAASVVLDLSPVPSADRAAYLTDLWKPLLAQREDTGLPHWIVLDEAQNLHLGRTPGVGLDATEGLCLVSYQPERLDPALLRHMDWEIELSPTGRNGLVIPRDGEPVAVTIAQRTTRHVRHWHKYVDDELPADLRFQFRDPTGCAPAASTLRQFADTLRTVPAAVLHHHAHHGDFSRWLSEVYRDHLLAELVRTTERDLVAHGDAERTRRLLVELVSRRYLVRPC
jgi:hydroxymethylpyrimidine pyrophosphatase-like HAD family hydrolase